MAIFNVNGTDADTLAEAIELCRAVWAEYKAPAVLEQRKEALAKETPLDRERAEAGVSVKLGSQT